MAEVFLGSTVGAEGFSRKVAIKRVLPGFSDNEAFAGMFIAEARISSQLIHPNIVSVLDFDRDAENRLFLVMELVEGKDLDHLVSSGLLPFPVVIYVIGEVLRGLGYAHDLPVGSGVRGVVHRDVSPHNVLLSWEGAVKVSDFGIAKARAASEATASVFIKGKPAYMSPEQANGQPLDGRSDLFAVGIMLWEMLVGRRLFVAADTRATLAAVLFGQIPRPRSLRGEVPKDVERVVMKLLERDLPARYATAEEALAELMACADAPRAGREALTAVLVERFGAEAPVRHSLLRSRAQSAPAPRDPSQPPFAVARTLADTATSVPALPSLGAMRNAPTGTLDLPRARPAPPGRSRLVKLLLAVAIATCAGFLGIAVVVSMSGGGDPDAGAGSDVTGAAGGSGSAGVAGAKVTQDAARSGTQITGGSGGAGDGRTDARLDVPPDAPPFDAAAAGAPAADAAKKDAPAGQQRPPGAEKTGTLRVVWTPQVRVYVDGRSYGDTPTEDIPLKVGKHTVRLVNLDAEPPIDTKRTVEITANTVTTLNWNK